MHELISISVVDTDAIHTLPLSAVPLKNRSLRRARLIKNSRLESVVELFSSKETGSGQVSVFDLARTLDFSGDTKSDLAIIRKLSGLASYDIYSLRIEFRRMGANFEHFEHLKLSDEKIAELSTYMQAFTRPLLAAIFGAQYNQQLDFRQILKLLTDPDDTDTRQRLLGIVSRLKIDLKALPSFLEQYGDVYLSLAYYQNCLDQIQPVLEQIYRTLHEIRDSGQFAADELLRKTCDFVEHKLKNVADDVTHILEMFRERTADMWEDVSAAKFHANRELVFDYQTKIGGALCALTVKGDAWARMFPRGEACSIYQRANFVSNELKQGLEKIEEIKYFDPGAMVA